MELATMALGLVWALLAPALYSRMCALMRAFARLHVGICVRTCAHARWAYTWARERLRARARFQERARAESSASA
eukprot:2423280-Alexandrium_andersonii.AAC.1